MQNRSFARYARAVLGYNLFVVLWGAYVRATGSGAGCGRHWPLCSGEVVPRSAQAETVIELGHRLTSGLALLAPVWLQLVHLLLADLLWIALVLLAAAALADSPRRSEPRDRHRAPAASAA